MFLEALAEGEAAGGGVVFGELGVGFVMLLIAVAAFAWIARSFRSGGESPAPVDPGRAAERPAGAYAGD